MNEALVALGISAVTTIAWFSRLEWRGSTNARDIERLEKRLESHESKLTELDNRVMDKLLNIERMVANIQGQMSKQ